MHVMTAFYEQVKSEIRFFGPEFFDRKDREKVKRHFAKLDAWVVENLPFKAKLPSSRKATKAQLRRWMNRNFQKRWCFTVEGVAFESDIDGTFYKLFWV